jgi:hypothetical protein
MIAKSGSQRRTPAIALLACLVIGPTVHAEQAGTHGLPEPSSQAPRLEVPRRGELPILFEPNLGQAAPQFAYIASGVGYQLALSEDGLTLSLPTRRASPSTDHLHRMPPSRILHLRLIGAARHPVLRPEGRKASFSNYFIGNDPKHWRTHVPDFAAVRYAQVYPGIDWVIYGNRRHLLEYDLVVYPQADPTCIAFAVGAEQLSLDRNGELLIDVHGRVIRQLRPLLYQVSATGVRERIKGWYTLDDRRVRISVGPYDHSRTLYIDPALAYSTYLGGTAGSHADAIAVDGDGNAYVVGEADSDFPTVDPYQAVNSGDNAFVAKFDPSGTRLLYSTFLGGSGDSEAYGVAVDSTGSIYVAGMTFSKDFPVVNAYESQFKGTGQAATQGFISKFSPDGGTLEYSTYLGGSGVINQVAAVALDSSGDAYVAGSTDSTDFPTTAHAIETSLPGRLNAFVTEFNPSGNGLVYSTYLGGTGADDGNAIAVDASGSAYVAGNTNSTDFPLVNPFQSTNYASANGSTTPTAFVAKLNAQGTGLKYSSYLGGSGGDVANGIAVDNAGEAFVTGWTASTDFPTVNAYQDTNRDVTGLGGASAFVTKISSSGTALVYSSYLGGSGGGQGMLGDNGRAIAIDGTGNAYIAGYSASTDFPTVNAAQETNDGAAIETTNAFVSELDPTGGKLLFSTYLGGSGSWGPDSARTAVPFGDGASGVALDKTGSTDYPTLNAFQSTNKSATNYGADPVAFVAKFGAERSASQSSTPPAGHGGGGAIGWGLIGMLSLALGFRSWGRRPD